MEMVETSELVTFQCPHCGHVQKGRHGEKPQCPKCTPDFKGWFSKIDLPDREKNRTDGIPR